MNLSASVLSLSVLGPKDPYPLCSVLSCLVWVLGRVFGWAVCACVPACHGLTHSPNQDSQHHGKGNFYLVKRVCELWALGQNTLLRCLSTLRWDLTCRVLCLYLGKAQDHPPNRNSGLEHSKQGDYMVGIWTLTPDFAAECTNTESFVPICAFNSVQYCELKWEEHWVIISSFCHNLE